jgi:hypothetical protein
MTASRNTSANDGVVPRVFLSYARSDGEQFATELRQRLETEHIPLWQDRVGMEGGRDCHHQHPPAQGLKLFVHGASRLK